MDQKPSLIRIAHFSDFHFGEREHFSHALRTRLIIDLTNWCESTDSQIDFIVISGDIFDKGNYNKKSHKPFLKWIDELCSAVSVSKDRILIVPGNHDLDRNKVHPEHHMIREHPENVRDFLNVTAAGCDCHIPFEEYEQFCKKAGILPFSGTENWLYGVRNFEKEKICFLGLNSSFLCGNHPSREEGMPKEEIAIKFRDDAEKGKLYLGKKTVDICVNGYDENHSDYIKIGIMHHPNDYFSPHSKYSFHSEDGCYAVTNAVCDVILCGHIHPQEIRTEMKSGEGASELVGGALKFNSLKGKWKEEFAYFRVLDIERNPSLNLKYLIKDTWFEYKKKDFENPEISPKIKSRYIRFRGKTTNDNEIHDELRIKAEESHLFFNKEFANFVIKENLILQKPEETKLISSFTTEHFKTVLLENYLESPVFHPNFQTENPVNALTERDYHFDLWIGNNENFKLVEFLPVSLLELPDVEKSDWLNKIRRVCLELKRLKNQNGRYQMTFYDATARLIQAENYTNFTKRQYIKRQKRRLKEFKRMIEYLIVEGGLEIKELYIFTNWELVKRFNSELLKENGAETGYKKELWRYLTTEIQTGKYESGLVLSR